MNLRPLRPERSTLPNWATPRNGANSGTRTHDLQFTKLLLYRLSYVGTARILRYYSTRGGALQAFVVKKARIFFVKPPRRRGGLRGGRGQRQRRQAEQEEQALLALQAEQPLLAAQAEQFSQAPQLLHAAMVVLQPEQVLQPQELAAVWVQAQWLWLQQVTPLVVTVVQPQGQVVAALAVLTALQEQRLQAIWIPPLMHSGVTRRVIPPVMVGYAATEGGVRGLRAAQ